MARVEVLVAAVHLDAAERGTSGKGEVSHAADLARNADALQ